MTEKQVADYNVIKTNVIQSNGDIRPIKHIFGALVLAMACCPFRAAADDGIDELCREVLHSIAADEPVAYA